MLGAPKCRLLPTVPSDGLNPQILLALGTLTDLTNQGALPSAVLRASSTAGHPITPCFTAIPALVPVCPL